MRQQIRHGKCAVDRNAVVDDVKIGALEVHHTLAPSILHIGVTNVPFLWNDPIEYWRAAGNFIQLQRDISLKLAQRRTQTLARDAATNGKKVGRELPHGLARVG